MNNNNKQYGFETNRKKMGRNAGHPEHQLGQAYDNTSMQVTDYLSMEKLNLK